MSLDSSLHTALPATRCRVAILGFGTVGSAVARRLTGPDAVPGLELACICDRRAAAKRSILRHGDGIAWTTSADDLLHSGADVIVETIGGLEPAHACVRRALLAGQSVVTANKQLIARAGPSLLALAARQGRQLRFEAAVGGAMPVIRAIGDGLAGDCITRIVAILNGTTNAVLSRMESTRCTLDAALAEARAQGYAEADATLDIDGGDAAAKLSILSALAFGLRVDPGCIETRSISAIAPADFDLADRRGNTIRQLAHAVFDRRRSTLTAWVAPVGVPRASLFGRTVGAYNAAVISGSYAGDIAISGPGAGGDATAVAVISDIVAIARDRGAVVPAPVLTSPRILLGLSHFDLGRSSGFSPPTSDCGPLISDFRLETSDFLFAEAV